MGYVCAFTADSHVVATQSFAAVLLDGFEPAALGAIVPTLRALAARRGAAVVLEASGVEPGRLAAYASSGIDLISTSAPVTRSAWLDISMRFEPLS